MEELFSNMIFKLKKFILTILVYVNNNLHELLNK